MGEFKHVDVISYDGHDVLGISGADADFGVFDFLLVGQTRLVVVYLDIAAVDKPWVVDDSSIGTAWILGGVLAVLGAAAVHVDEGSAAPAEIAAVDPFAKAGVENRKVK